MYVSMYIYIYIYMYIYIYICMYSFKNKEEARIFLVDLNYSVIRF